MKSSGRSATAFAPATIANLAVGFDVLGLCFDVRGDWVTVEKNEESPQVLLQGLSGVVTDLPQDPLKNTATAGLHALVKDLKLPHGFKVNIRKGIPLGSGLGGSAASAVGAIVAANALLDKPLPQSELLAYALIGESAASGSVHADNVAPCLFGGLTVSMIEEDSKVRTIPLPVPEGLHCVLIHPHCRIDTRHARGLLSHEITLKQHIRQSARLAAFVSSCYSGNIEWLEQVLKDELIEPQRCHLIPGLRKVQAAARDGGALGCSISGSGPSVFAFAPNETKAYSIKKAMLAAFQNLGIASDGWSKSLPCSGARLIQ